MRLSIKKLRFSLPDAPLAQYESRLNAATSKIRKIARDSGTHSDKFTRAFKRVEDSLRQDRNLAGILQSPLELRALALLFNTETAIRIKLTPDVFNKINQVRSRPSSLLLEAIFSHYMKYYDQLEDCAEVESWLMTSKEQRRELTEELNQILGGNGPKWLAEESHRLGKDFDEQVRHVRLDRYLTGRFLTVSKNIYYLDVLRDLQPNEFNPILDEMQKKSVYNSRYDETSLLGHQILSILIDKAPSSGVGDEWLNVVLAIGGDPRVPLAHPNYRKWWSQIDPRLTAKVQGWLSKLDLRLFLEALENFSYQSGSEDLKRMYPARKQFMEGLLNKQLVTGTRLFLSYAAERYLKRNYRPEHLPNYSVVDGYRSLIHIQLGRAHMIEGSHNCKLWIYDRLDASAVVFDYSKNQFTYQSLTSGLSYKMATFGIRHRADISHSPHNYTWQNKAIGALKEIGISIESKDVLSIEDYKKYKRRYGA